MNIPLHSISRSSRPSFLLAAALAFACAAPGLLGAENLAPKVAVIHPVAGETFTDPAEIHVLVEAADGDGLIRSVEVFADTGSLGVVTPNPASASPVYPFQWTWTNPPAGEHKLVAKATDDAGVSTMSDPVVFVVRRSFEPSPATLVILKPANGSRFVPGDLVAIEAVASDVNGEIRRVEFYANDRQIGVSEVLAEEPAGSGRRREHLLEWTPGDRGVFQIVAKATDSKGNPVESRPVAISVGAALPVVSIEATRPETREPSPNVRVAPGAFLLKRTAVNLADPLTVYMTYSGSATPGVDYQKLPQSVTFPAGTAELELLVEPLEDAVAEGDEIVVAGIGNDLVSWASEHLIDPERGRAKVLIHDANSATGAVLEIHTPTEGQSFNPGETITINAVAVDPAGYIARVEFFDFETRIGVSEITFIRAPDPGTPIHHTFEWQNPPAGHHLLTVRAEDSNGNRLVSKPVRIFVQSHGGGLPKVRVESIDPEAMEFSPDVDGFDPARFLISREGDLDRDLAVYFTLHGTAEPGLDYARPERSAVIPAGKAEVTVEIVPLSDEQLEPMETVALRILDPLPLSSIPEPTAYVFEPSSREAAAVIFDRMTPENGAVELALPDDGETYVQWQRVRMLAAAYHPTADVSHVDFYSGENLIGSSDIAFFQPNGGGLIMHEFNWDQPIPGEHVITARARLPDGTELISSPVKINVPAIPQPVVLEIVAVDPDAAEVGPENLPDPAVFEIRRVNGPVDVAVTVWYAVEGSAVNGVDYGRLEGMIALPAGHEKVELVVKPVLDRALEGEESVIIALQPPACIAIFPPPPSCYHIAEGSVAKAVIQDYGLAPGTAEAGTVVFKGIERQGDGAVRLRMAAPVGSPCVLETSTDLIHWTEVAPVTLPDGVLVFRDEGAKMNQQRFYRTRLP